ncbi:13E12 repeat family protein, partial [Frankia sp. AgKG'84/4]|nr:13E12 repeat family protein [Frankia sp. AgKG'84/4]
MLPTPSPIDADPIPRGAPRPTDQPAADTRQPHPEPAPPAGLEMGVDAENAPLTEVAESICQWAGRFAAATCGWLGLLAAFDRRDGWNAIGIRSCAHWLSWRCGLGLRAAREHLATAHALDNLPQIRAAFAAGELSYSKIRAITRVATPDTEPFWLHHAHHCTASQLDRLAAATRATTTDPTTQRNARRLTLRTDPNGMIRLTALLPPDDAALLLTALDAAGTSLDTTDPPPPPDQNPAADGAAAQRPRDRTRDTDALIALADTFLHHNAPTLQNPHHTLNIHITADPTPDPPTSNDHAGPPRTTPTGRPPATTATIGPWTLGLPPATIRRLRCDGHLRTLLT